MPQLENKSYYAFDRPGNYRIRIEGTLDKNWSERLGNMAIARPSKTAGRGKKRSVTVLEGFMRDQAELVGVVNTLYNLHLTLLSLEYRDEKELNKKNGL